MKTYPLSSMAATVACVLTMSSVTADEHFELVKDIFEGTASSSPLGLTSIGDKVYFAATGEDTGKELYVTNGEEDETMLVKDINPSGDSNPSEFVEFRNKVYFRADDGENGAELWMTDGTADGTMLLKDINEGSASSNPADFVVLGNKLVFEATTEEYGRELWVTDGTEDGTELLEDIQEGSNGSSPSLKAEYKIGDDILLFTANDGEQGNSLYSTDATPGGATLLKSSLDTDGAPLSMFVNRPLDDDVDEILFAVGDELWTTDGTTSGTKRIREGVSIGSDSRMSSYKLDGKTLFFGREAEQDADSLWETDGTASGTKVLFSGLDTGITDVSRKGASTTVGISFGPVIGDKISLLTDNGVGVDVWVTDGDDIDRLISKTYDFVLNVKPSADDEQAVFVMMDGNDMQLYTSDYTEDNTIKGPTFTDGISSGAGELVTLEDEDFAIFTLNSADYGVELWKFTFPDLDAESPTASPVSPNPPDFDSAPSARLGLATLTACIVGMLACV